MEYREQDISISLGTIIKAVLVVLFFALLFFLKDIVFVLLMSILVASAVEPGTQWFVRHKIPRIFSVIFIYISIAVCLVSIVFFLLIPLLSETSDFLRNFPTYFNAGTISNTLNSNSFFSSQSISSFTNSINLEQVISQINSVIGSVSSNTFGTVATFFGGFLSFLLMVILSFYLAVEEDGVGKFLKAITTIKHEKYVISLWKRSQRKIGLWMQGQLILAVIIGMLVYLGLLIINVPNALLLAVLAAAFEIIPLFGPILASIPAIAIAFVTGGVPFAGVVAGLYIIIHQFENQLIYPLVVKKVVGVSPVVSIVALAVGWQLAGFIGLILSVPIAAVIIEFFDDFEKDKIEKYERMNIES
ncbi:MAG: AI-2E family transporter [Candidatus Zambryskibacteria bacterium]|nr:AI-2E family transporter [Candidatus Zambryskibacteria bacterium]